MIHDRRIYARVCLALLCLACGPLTFTEEVCGAEAPQGLTVSTTSPVHPVLIRNEHGPLLRVIVDAADPKDMRVNAVSFKLDGTDDLGDLDSLTLFSTGDRDEFSPATSFGEPAKPAAELTFRGERALSADKNVFWLSCQLKATANLSHRVAATCTAIETTAGKLTPRDGSPGVRHRIGVAIRRHKDDGVHTYRIPALATSPKGTLHCVYDMRRRTGRDLQEDIDIGLSRSTDGGQTWEPVRVIMDMGEFGGLPQEQNGCSDPGIIVDRQTGEIFCFAVWMNGKPGKHQWSGDGSEPGFEIGKSAQLLMVRSKGDGLTWSKPENLTRKLKKEAWWLFAPSPQQGIQLADGTLVMPAQGRDEHGKEFSTVMTSCDHGANWTVATPAYSGGSECQAVQLGDGSLMLNMRNEHDRFRAVFTTRDLGTTWEPHATNCNTLIEPNCNGSLLRVDYEQAGEKKHVLLFANPHTQKGRTHHTIQVSFDEGHTWPQSHHVLLDEGRGAGYPSLTCVDDQHVGIVYEGSQSHLVFERLSLDELLRR
jgi:sialidase-1